MSLTSHLDYSGSPVRRWFDDCLPVPRAFTTRLNRRLRADRCACPCPPPIGSNLPLVGTAIDYVLRAYLLPNPFERTVAQHAYDQLQAAEIQTLYDTAIRDITILRPWNVEDISTVAADVCEAALALAALEQLARAGMYLVPDWVDRIVDADGDIEKLRAGLAAPATREDLRTLTLATVPAHLGLRHAKVLHPNPKFVQSIPLRGADADLIAGRTLIDFKSTKRTTIVSNRDIHQVLGYALADTYDQYQIDTVSISALRWGVRATWRLEALLAELSGETQPLQLWRGEFAELLKVHIEAAPDAGLAHPAP